ncbi:type I restriction endonuclease subunit R [Microbispora catharanthi]|uniref:Type I restriction endonuclease subunit R n=1 Tax=Microbispora catharanthi TaxID=1712871 RepID=A0A5N6BZL1_9ACTN|nr:type I restriction endonuclease [Microbispora catharanthi]KAB8185976.1 type I restriction endonuclease subunit R [Microbispora catharanthi]
MGAKHKEEAFREAILAGMRERGWEVGQPSDYRADLGLATDELFTFIGATQIDAWNELLALYGDDAEAAQQGFVRRLNQAIATDGVLEVLRNGVKDRGIRIRLAYFKPNLVESDDVLTNYRANRLTVIREVAYATKKADQGHRLDLVLFVNGIPVATAELKNPLTGQGVEQAKKQYRDERDPTELIFTQRVVANFAVDPDLVFVAPKLRGRNTQFLPFNTGSEGPGESGGAGNPVPAQSGKYPTSYLWEQVWERDNWLDLLERFVHLHKAKKSAAGSILFPRFHQWDAVKKLTAHAVRHGAGQNYLVMHSAGSGKSNTIAWLAHRLSALHTSTDVRELDPGAVARGLKPGVPVFDKTIIITDRRNLDAQLRETVGRFEQTAGLVVKIDEKRGAKSTQLAAALSSETGKIITVTLATFPVLVEYLKENPTEIKGRTFAIIVDEAHSSQSGEAAKAVRAALRDLGLDAEDEEAGATSVTVDTAKADMTVKAKLERSAADRGRAANISYFAFTATPKAKTLELFGTPVKVGGELKYKPFHTYAMRQAIEEKFILDPLRNYVTYDTYWKLVNNNPDDREVEKSKASPLLAKYALTHDATVAQQATVIVEHFLAHTRGRMGGRAKAMVVTASRLSAVLMSRAIKEELEIRKADVGVLVAFSGTLNHGDEKDITEVKENGGLSEDALPKAFEYTRADDKVVKAGGKGRPEYRILVVAEKYQTGFDEPLLTTMYVNKKLSGIAAVQTLSRLNRTAERQGKSQTDLAVIDFVNDAEQIKESFRPYFEEAMTLPSDPNLLYTAQSKVMSAELLYRQEMLAFAAALLEADEVKLSAEKLHAELYRLLAPAVGRFKDLLDSDDEHDRAHAETFRSDLDGYVSKYGFLSQVIPYRDVDLELLYVYGRYLLARLPHGAKGDVDLGEIDLTHVRTEQTGVHDLRLTPEGAADLKGFGDGSGQAKDEEKSLLSDLIERFNQKFGTDFTEQDLIVPFNEAVADPKVRQAAVANVDPENFGHVFNDIFEDKVADHVDNLRTLGDKFFDKDPTFREALTKTARRAAWRLIRAQEGLDDLA